MRRDAGQGGSATVHRGAAAREHGGAGDRHGSVCLVVGEVEDEGELLAVPGQTDRELLVGEQVRLLDPGVDQPRVPPPEADQLLVQCAQSVTGRIGVLRMRWERRAHGVVPTLAVLLDTGEAGWPAA